MTIDATRQASIQQIADYVHDVQEVEPNQTTKEELQGLGQNFLYGLPMMAAMPVITNLTSRPYSIWQHMRQNGTTWSQARNFIDAQKAQERQALQYLKNPSSRWLTLGNKRMFNMVKDLDGLIPRCNPNQDISKLQGKELIKFQNAQRSSKYYGEARRLIEEAKSKKMTGEQLKAQLRKIREAMGKGDAKVCSAMEKGLLKPTSKLGQAKHWIKSKTGGYKFESKLLKSTKGANALRMAKKCAKGGTALMAVIEGVMEIPDVISAFKIDGKRGAKQLVKSGVKVGASVLGYAAGSAAAGAIAGSVFPGIGNVVGAVVGFAGGLIGGWLASKAASKTMDHVLGEKDSLNKSEAQIYAEQQNDKNKQAAALTAENAGKSNDALDQLLALANDKAESEGGWSSQDILDSFDKLVQERESTVQQGDYTTNVDTSLGEQTIQGTDDWYLHQLNNLGSNLSFVPVAQSISNTAENIYNYGQNLYLNW